MQTAHQRPERAKEKRMSRRTRQCVPVQSDIVVVGIDVAKEEQTAVAVSGAEQEAKPLKFGFHQEGFEKLVRYASEAVRRREARRFVAAMEPTGHYGLPLATWLEERGVEVWSVQPLHTSRAKELFDGTRRKTDAKDARVIADLCRRGRSVRYPVARGPFAELKVLCRQREQWVKRRSQVVNRLHRHLDVVFPELRRIFSDLEGRTSVWVLQNAPTPSDVLALGDEKLWEAFRRVGRGQACRERLEKLEAAARTSVGIREGLEGHRLAIRQLLDELKWVNARKGEVERMIFERFAEVPYAGRLVSLPRLGRITAATLLGEFGDLRSYSHPRQLIKMAGLDLVEHSSGERKGRRYISRRGRRYARQLLYMAALRLGGRGGALEVPRTRMVEGPKKVKPVKAAVANMCRLLRILHAIARDGVGFEAGRYGDPSTKEAA